MSFNPVKQKGKLVLVVGASGVGKDTLLGAAKDHLRDEPRIHFVTRSITRPPSVGEDHRSVTPDEFAAKLQDGAYSLHWDAHGLRYGLPVEIDAWLENGDVVVANGSRSALREAESRYPELRVLNIVAEPAVLAERLRSRRRERDEEIAARLARAAVPLPGSFRIEEIDNSGNPNESTAKLIASLTRLLQA